MTGAEREEAMPGEAGPAGEGGAGSVRSAPGGAAQDGDLPIDGLADPAHNAILRRVVMQESAPLYIAGLDGTLWYANFAYRRAAARVNSQDGILSLAPTLSASFRRAIAEVKRTERRLRTAETIEADGHVQHSEWQHFPVYDDDGALVAVGGCGSDNTASARLLRRLRRDNERFNDFLRGTSDWMWEIDASSRITFISENVTELCGRPPAALKGHYLSELGSFIEDPDSGSDAIEAMSMLSAFRNQLFQIRDGDGQTRICRVSAVPVFDEESGAFQGYRGTGTDITERHLVERQALDSRRELERTFEELTLRNAELDLALARAKSATETQADFLANMSHELRTPLNSIIGFADIMSQQMLGPLDEHYREYSESMLEAGRHLLSLIDDVLDLDGLESGRLDLAPQATSLKALLDEAYSLVALRAEEKRLRTDRIRVDREWLLMADPRRALQILVNLLGNAVKFTPEGGAVGVDVAPEGHDLLAVTIWDTGPGIPEQKRAEVFEKFRQVHEGAYTRSHGGAGLGLAIAHALARQMGGEIRLDSAPDQGCRFTVVLPLVLSFENE